MSYPEHEKLQLVKPKSQIIGEFLEWIEEEGLYLSKYSESGYLSPYYGTTNELLAKYYGINLTKLEQEKKQMLNEIKTK